MYQGGKQVKKSADSSPLCFFFQAVVSGWRNLHAPSILVRQDGQYVDVEISSAREMPDGSWALKLKYVWQPCVCPTPVHLLYLVL